MQTDLLPTIWSVGAEVKTSVRYYIDNTREAKKPAGATYAIQRTLAGAGFWEQGPIRQLVPAGQALLFSHDESSRYGYPAEATEAYRLQHITFNPAMIRPLFDALRAEFGSVVRMDPEGEAANLFEDIMGRYHRGRFRDALHAGETLFRLVLAIFREQRSPKHAQDPVALGHELLSGDIGLRFGLKEIARRVGISREHFCRQYSLRYGVSPGFALRQLRMAQARAMLYSTSLAIEDIAASCGFGSGNSFQQAYRAHFGENPSTSRNR